MPVPFAYLGSPDRVELVDGLAFLAAFVLGYVGVTWLFPSLLRPMWWLYIHVAYRFRVYHADRLPAAGPALIVCNHSSYIDWLILWVACPRPVKFVLWSGYYHNSVLRFLLSFCRHRTVRLDNRTARPHAVADALDLVVKELDAGHAVVVFPEGRLTRNGQMRPFGRGIERLVKLARQRVPVVPVCIDNMWGSVFSHKDGPILRKWPEDFRRRVTVYFGKPLPPGTTAPEARAAVQECLADAGIALSDDVLPVHRWFVQSASSWRLMFRPLYVDVATGTERTLTNGRALVAAWCLARWFRPRLGPGDHPVGIWLPTGMGSALANVALAFLRRPAVNLNYTAGPDAVASAAQQAGVTHVITAARFEQKMPCPLPATYQKLLAEDALAAIPGWEKTLKFLAVLVLPHWVLSRIIGLYRTKMDDLLTIIFSSGSTGAPKGVMLSYRNISSNGDAFKRGVQLVPKDVMMGSLPFFHSFGYTVCLWAPTGIGMKVVHYPDPRAAKEVGELTRKHQCTILLGTATFLRFYIRRCGPDDFKSCRYIICGAEKLPVKLAEEFNAKFGVWPLEGYGCTEVSPVVSTNMNDVEVAGVRQVANVLGTVGQPIPGVAVKAFHPETYAPLPPGDEGVLGVKGPNVMLGYLHKLEKTKDVIRDGWYMTGDMGFIEPDGFIRITGRLSRFAKIAGEMVPLEKIEEELQDLLGGGERTVAVVPVPDEKRGERIVVLYHPDVEEKLPAALAGLSARGIPNLWIPDRRDCYKVESFPVLGSGKLDLRAVAEVATQVVGGKS
jgi:acyl-[acyl-carrier-protein]-phospholipid O-acyltransferase/long-chain-fatty-acid--[acyl-carrier-protein] ligase